MKINYALAGRLALFGAAFIWGTSFVVLKSAIGSMGTLWTLAVRFAIAAVIMLVMARKRLKSMDRQSLRGAVLMGVCVSAAYILQTYGLMYTTPGKNAFLTASYCVQVPFLAWAIYKRKPTVFNIAAAALCVTGIGFVALNSGFGQLNLGDVITLSSGLFYSLQIIMVERYVGEADSVAVVAVQITVAALVCLLGAVLFESPPEYISVSQWTNILYLSVMCTAACFFLQAWGMRYTPSAPAAMILTLEAVFGALISVLFFGESITFKVFFGFALIFVAVVLSEAGQEVYTKYFKKPEKL